MHHKHIFLALLVCLTSCSTKRPVTSGTSEAQYVLAFKKAVLYGCIDKATEGKFSEFTKENNDLGLAVVVAVMQHSETRQARELGAEMSKNIKSSSYMDHEGRKPVFDQCVNYAFSNKTDSLAFLAYKIFQKNEGKLFY